MEEEDQILMGQVWRHDFKEPPEHTYLQALLTVFMNGVEVLLALLISDSRQAVLLLEITKCHDFNVNFPENFQLSLALIIDLADDLDRRNHRDNVLMSKLHV